MEDDLSVIPQPSQAPTVNLDDPDLVLTPERTITEQINKSRKAVRFISPAKPKACRQVKLEGKENELAYVELSSPVVAYLSKAGTKSKKQPGQKKNKNNCNSIKTEIKPAQQLSVETHLGRPELHSTLHIGRDIQQLQDQNIDLVHAVRYRLAVSEKDRKVVKQKTYSKLNRRVHDSNQYNKIVSVDVPSECVVKGAENQLRKSVKFVPVKSDNEDFEKPSLMKYFKPEKTFHKVVSRDEHGFQPSCLTLTMPCINQSSFDLHARMSIWEEQ